VPVTPLGTGLTVDEAPGCKPFGPTDSPGTIPNEEVMPGEGVFMPTWAKTGLWHNNKDQIAATMQNDLMEDSPITANAASARKGRIELRFITARKGKPVSAYAPRSTFR
jgi:hypothetical protein